MDPQTKTTRPGEAGGRLNENWEQDPTEAATGNANRSPADAFKDLGRHFGELKEYAAYYLTAKADGIKTSVRNLVLYAVLGMVGLIAGGAAVVTATVLLITGIAGAISAIFRSHLTEPDRTWIGEITVGLLILGGIAVGTMLFMKKFTAASRERTVRKYESRQQHQRIQYGHDVHERAEHARNGG